MIPYEELQKEPFTPTEGAEAAMLHCHVSTVAQNGHNEVCLQTWPFLVFHIFLKGRVKQGVFSCH